MSASWESDMSAKAVMMRLNRESSKTKLEWSPSREQQTALWAAQTHSDRISDLLSLSRERLPPVIASISPPHTRSASFASFKPLAESERAAHSRDKSSLQPMGQKKLLNQLNAIKRIGTKNLHHSSSLPQLVPSSST